MENDSFHRPDPTFGVCRCERKSVFISRESFVVGATAAIQRATGQRRPFLKTAGLSISELCGGDSANQHCILTLAKHVAWFSMS